MRWKWFRANNVCIKSHLNRRKSIYATYVQVINSRQWPFKSIEELDFSFTF